MEESVTSDTARDSPTVISDAVRASVGEAFDELRTAASSPGVLVSPPEHPSPHTVFNGCSHHAPGMPLPPPEDPVELPAPRERARATSEHMPRRKARLFSGPDASNILSMIDSALQQERRDAALAIDFRHRELLAKLFTHMGGGAGTPMSCASVDRTEIEGPPLKARKSKVTIKADQAGRYVRDMIDISSQTFPSRTLPQVVAEDALAEDKGNGTREMNSDDRRSARQTLNRRMGFNGTRQMNDDGAPRDGEDEGSDSVSESSSSVSSEAARYRYSTFFKHGSDDRLDFVERRTVRLDDNRWIWQIRLEALVKSNAFEVLFAFLIFSNTVVLTFEAQYNGMKAGSEIEYPEYNQTDAALVWPNAERTFSTMDMVFGIIFTVELLVKIVALRASFAKEAWNWVDALIVFSWLLTALRTLNLPVDPMLLRLARLARLLRLLRLVRTVKGFDKLYVMITAIRGSFSALAWSAILLVLVQMMIALCLQAMLEPFITDDSQPDKLVGRREVYKFYGTFARAMLTMFEITLGNWMPPCRALVENVNEGYMMFSLCHKMIIGFSVVSVITGVFIQETFKVTVRDDKVMLAQKEQAALAHAKKMQALFRHADTDHNGKLNREEFHAVLSDCQIRTWLAAMELDVQDADQLFDLIHDGIGQVTAHELVRGTGRLKGAARSIDLVTLLHENRECRVLLKKVLDAVGHTELT